jgi:DNA (cytosine-5)-methyltransferase 1
VRLLDLFSKAGGAAMGYHQAGFEVVGVDIKKQKRFPFEFIQADAIELLQDKSFIDSFDVITASPPCQTHSITQHLRDAQGNSTKIIDLIPETRAGLIASGKPYVIENVVNAPLINAITLCGSSFGLKVRRHRKFESNIALTSLPCDHKAQGKPIGIYGAMNDNPQGLDRKTGRYVYGGKTATNIEEAREAMGIDWMIWGELVEAIPPAYTFHIGKQLLMGVLSE